MTGKRNTTDRKTAKFGRNTLFALAAGVAIGGGVLLTSPSPTQAQEIMVYKNPSCGCCGKWADYMRAKGFSVEVKAVDDMNAVKERAGIPGQLESCHTAFIGDYVIEGHVPAAEISRLLTERPNAKGLSVPGMVAGSPGMEGRYSERYKVFLFRADGATKVYASY